MAIINLVSFIFYIVAAMSLAIAVPIPTTMPEGSGEAITEPYSNDTNITTTEAMASIPSVPAFQCQAGVDYSQSMWSLFNGLTRVTYYFNSVSIKSVKLMMHAYTFHSYRDRYYCRLHACTARARTYTCTLFARTSLLKLVNY